MTEEEQKDLDTFSLASVTMPKRPWRAQEDSNVSKPQPQNISQARPVIPQAVAKAQSIKSAQSDKRSVQLQRSAQDQPVTQTHFPVMVSQGQGQSQGRPVEKQARSEALDRVAEAGSSNSKRGYGHEATSEVP